MPRYILHIGPHKTGTTYLQASFLRFRSELSDRGVCYPAEWQGGLGPGLYGLFRRLQQRDIGLKGEFQSLNQSDNEAVLISAEDLSTLGVREIDYFAEVIGSWPAI